jgi:hypothetical protein
LYGTGQVRATKNWTRKYCKVTIQKAGPMDGYLSVKTFILFDGFITY